MEIDTVTLSIHTCLVKTVYIKTFFCSNVEFNCCVGHKVQFSVQTKFLCAVGNLEASVQQLLSSAVNTNKHTNSWKTAELFLLLFFSLDFFLGLSLLLFHSCSFICKLRFANCYKQSKYKYITSWKNIKALQYKVIHINMQQ